MTYAESARIYVEAGWGVPFPLPAGQKSPPPDGVTGQHGVDIELEAAVLPWTFEGGCNYGLRMPEGVMGLDVDQYGAKTGAETLAGLEERLGALPAGPWSSSRAWPSGIRFFRVPAGVRLAGVAGKDIEVIQPPPVRRGLAVGGGGPGVPLEHAQRHGSRSHDQRGRFGGLLARRTCRGLAGRAARGVAGVPPGGGPQDRPARPPSRWPRSRRRCSPARASAPRSPGCWRRPTRGWGPSARAPATHHDRPAFRLAHLCAAGHLSWIQGAGHLQGLWAEHVGDGGERGEEFVGSCGRRSPRSGRSPLARTRAP